ncbi:MAG: hypothetical protein ACI4MP_01110 [Candidatus Ventricola sp.]
MTQNTGLFTLVSPGTYQVTAILNTPSCTRRDAAQDNGQGCDRCCCCDRRCDDETETDVYLLVNGAILPSTQTHLRSGQHTGTTSIQAHIVSNGHTTVGLAAADALHYTGAHATDVLASIAFLRLT